jgi:hypothetical protein
VLNNRVKKFISYPESKHPGHVTGIQSRFWNIMLLQACNQEYTSKTFFIANNFSASGLKTTPDFIFTCQQKI